MDVLVEGAGGAIGPRCIKESQPRTAEQGPDDDCLGAVPETEAHTPLSPFG